MTQRDDEDYGAAAALMTRDRTVSRERTGVRVRMAEKIRATA